jgi:hypothetical protein
MAYTVQIVIILLPILPINLARCIPSYSYIVAFTLLAIT